MWVYNGDLRQQSTGMGVKVYNDDSQIFLTIDPFNRYHLWAAHQYSKLLLGVT